MDTDKNKLCEICHKHPAEKIVVQYINGVKKKYSVCSQCALLIGIDEQLQKDKISLETKYELTHTCSFCNWTLKDILDTGLLGCPYCFIEFEDEIRTIIEHFHNVKTPGTHDESSIETRLMVLNTQLNKAIAEERFEDAAKIRDMIKKIKEF
ncbi:hypothetical protein DRQ29_03055 [bacterium]|nr:MAG: hypothetical protein DRQ29_03055 [bacterium]